jgi:hypothetical protein
MFENFKPCIEIKCVIEEEIALGNKIKEVVTSWEKIKQVFEMQNPMSDFTKEKFQNFSNQLEYWESIDPHYAIENGFSCEKHKEGISFPMTLNSGQFL